MGSRHPWADCEGCPLNIFGAKYVGSSGPKRSDGAGIDGKAVQVAVVGEAPGYEEVMQRAPFIGPSGQLMRSALRDAGYDPDKAFYTNAVLCRPPDNKLEPYAAAVDHCRPRLERELALVGTDETPILAVGNYGVQTTLAVTQGDEAPKKLAITKNRGRDFPAVPGRRVQKRTYITVHPAYVLRQNSALGAFKQDVYVMKHGKPDHPLQHEPSWIEVFNVDDLQMVLDAVPDGSWVAFDVETEGLHWYTSSEGRASDLLLLGLYWSDKAPAIIIGEELLGDVTAKRVISEFFGRVKTAAHNGKFDVMFLQRDGIEGARSDFDTMLAHYMLQENPPHGLKELSALMFYVRDYEGELVTTAFKGVKAKDRNYRMIPHEQLAQYLAWDVACTHHLRIEFERQMTDEGLLEWPFYNLLMPLSNALMDTERIGIAVDRPYLERQHALIASDIETSTNILRRLSGRQALNPNSWQQVGDYLWKQQAYPFKASKHYADGSTSIAALQASGLVYVNTDNKFDSDIPFVKGLLHYRRLRKIQSTYVAGILLRLDEHDRVHPRYFEAAAETGRLSAKGPPIQTIPRSSGDYYGKMLRSAFVANARLGDEVIDFASGSARLSYPPAVGREQQFRLDGLFGPNGDGGRLNVPALIGRARFRKLVMADYSQAELRVWAHVTQDPYLLQVYREGRDLHNENAIRLYGEGYTKEQRTQMKNWVFAFVYGGDAYSFASQAKLPLARASAMVADFEKLVPVAAAWREKAWQEVQRRGFVQTIFGRKRRFPIINRETEKDVKHACWNFPIQSTASDLNSLAQVELWRAGYNVVLSMHDMLAVECWNDEAEEVGKALVGAMVGVGERWVSSVPWVVELDYDDSGNVGIMSWADRPEDEDRPDIGDILELRDQDFAEDAELLVAA